MFGWLILLSPEFFIHITLGWWIWVVKIRVRKGKQNMFGTGRGLFFKPFSIAFPTSMASSGRRAPKCFGFLDMSFVCLISFGIYLNQSHLFEDRSWSVRVVCTEPDLGEHKYEQEAASELFIHSRQEICLAWKKRGNNPCWGKISKHSVQSRNDCFQTDHFILKKRFRGKSLHEKSNLGDRPLLDHPTDHERYIWSAGPSGECY